MKKIHSLSFKVPFIISGIILIAILIVSIVNINIAAREVVDTTLNGFSTSVEGYSSMIDMIAHDQMVLGGTYARNRDVKNFLENQTVFDKSIISNLLLDFNAVNYYAINIGIANQDGIILVDSIDQSLVGKDLSILHSYLYNKSKSNNFKFAFDNILSSSITKGGYSLLVMGGVKGNNSQLIGFIYINLDVSKINKELVEVLKLPEGYMVSFINEYKRFILSSNIKLVGQILPSIYDSIYDTESGELRNYVGIDNIVRSAAFTTPKELPWRVIISRTNRNAFSNINDMIYLSIVVGIVVLLLSTLICIYFVRRISRPLNILVGMAGRISNGDLTDSGETIVRQDELGVLADSFTAMRAKLLDIIVSVREGAENINNSAIELSHGSNDLSHRTESQASSLEETAASMEEMASTIKSSTAQSVQGNKMMVESKKAISDAGGIILETTKNVEAVYEASTKIKDITKIIENIAFQTNILALNAAVEAARAGEQGKGFAVVASEVRNLAQTTQSSVKDITDLVDNAYDKINKATDSARMSQDIFNNLQAKIEETSKIMQDISSTAVEQQTGVDQVNKAVADMDSVTQQNAALVEESYASTMSLSNQAQELLNAVSFFKVNNGNISKSSSMHDSAKQGKKTNKVSSNSSYIESPMHSAKSTIISTSNSEFGNTFVQEDSDDDGFSTF